MRKQLLTLSFILLSSVGIAQAQGSAAAGSVKVVYEYKQITAIESVVSGGLGRSRILTTDDNGQMREKELKNFYSFVGINFDNISNNDRVIVDRINDFANEGWELVNVVTGSNQQSNGGSSGGGLFITRYIFRRQK
jgi:hypothetical protein